ncbi:MAG: MBL fold metallo-hydrolase, partial [Gammaproteobacteria bacterium]|nr:MBL fold metallo-hydrolase [Gammaproteobacteria bacterium]
VLPYFRARGIKELDALIISHDDIDHIGGVADVIKEIKVNKILGNKKYEFEVIPSEICHSHNDWIWDGVSFDFLHPAQDISFEGNNASCVLKIGHGKDSVLISGDIEYQAEDLLIETTSAFLRSNILLAPHHGSKTSSKSRFIRVVNPENVIFSTGYLNRFKLPNKDIITRYMRNGSSIWDTASDGAIHIEYKGEQYTITSERQNRAKFWNE